MKKATQPLVIANWKMNPRTLAEAKQLFVGIRAAARKAKEVTVLVAPPAVYLSDVTRLSPSGAVGIAAQNIWPEPVGAQTGEISAPMVRSCGATHVIIGHSERRAQGEDDAVVAKKISAVLANRLLPIVCIGERVRDDSGDFYAIVEAQITAAVEGRKKAEVGRMVIAYEPIWSIGTGKTPQAEEIQEMRLFIDKCITNHYDRATAAKVQVLYGGSVNAKNASTLHAEAGMDGFLVGGASLDSNVFGEIITAVR